MPMLIKVTWNQATPVSAPYLWEHHEAVLIAGSKEGAIKRVNKKFKASKSEVKAKIVRGIHHQVL